MGHHGGHGTTVAAMVHHVLSIYMSFVRELYVKYTFLPNKIFYCSRAIYPTRSKAPTDFSLLAAQNSSSNKNIAIVGMLDVDINAS